ncbi:MarR family transcriptional regulator [Pseudaminobacter sp. 19-2017]|uniref:MarR family transcriptional regulator n=1 Tax=Pseudaminobacter soli (ex Zhang et al. 2022) TaxID=2831468 RepID=A0A942IBX4_9HYPH|nr:MarR family transcriptional regulator [Pseudaminobacter soli]MBS3652056.1 MarR family transcriptional regulator [Pseudaminobacter soli]
MAKAQKMEDPAVAEEISRYRLPDGLFAPETSLPHAFTVVANRVSLTLQKMYSERFGLSVVGWRLMAILGTHSPLSAKALAELTAMDQVSTSRALDQLVAKRLVSRRVDPSDRRRVVLRLSKKGEVVYSEVVPVLFAAENALMSGLSAEDSRMIRSIMRKLIDRSAEVLPDDGDWQTVLRDYGYADSSGLTPADAENSAREEPGVPSE